jgi:[protein-PII] uridylyltransferase
LRPETATRRDLSDPRTASNVAAAVGDPVRLELLAALTVADSRATGPAAWSSWKGSLIDDLVRVVDQTLRGEDRTAARDLDGRFARLAALVPADGGVHIEHEPVGEFEVLRTISRDRRGLFAAIAGTLTMHGLDVVSADAFTGDDGTAVDEFKILRIEGGSPNWPKVEHDLRGVLAGDIDIESRLEHRIKSHGRRRAMAAAPPRSEVIISNDASDSSTMIDVRAPDGPAVLYRLSHALAGAGYDIRSAKVATLGHEVVDVFYVESPAGQHTAGDRDAVRTALTAALAH